MAMAAQGAKPRHLAALGDSLTAGYGLPARAAFPARLEAVLRARGQTVTIDNFGISGDTTTGGLARLETVIARRPDGVILELGTNDVLLGLPPSLIRAHLDAMLSRLGRAGIPVLLCGPGRLIESDRAYAASIEALYIDLARQHHAMLDPSFLANVVGQPALLQDDGLHPNQAGVDAIVTRILPTVETFLNRLGATPTPNAS